MKWTGDDLINVGFRKGRIIGLALEVIERAYGALSKEEVLVVLERVLHNPGAFLNDKDLSALAAEILKPADEVIALEAPGRPYQIYGAEAIESGALDQMETAMRLPVTVAGALMPDAHQGYGLPIGGVLATKNAVIPYGVGVDIGCRMCMTVYDLPVTILEEKKSAFKKMLIDNTKFGQAAFKQPKDHEIFERREFNEISIAHKMKDRAWQQIGSSGGGNHFVEFGIVEVLQSTNDFSLPAGHYVALLSHSGSRGLGANIAGHYTKIAMDTCKLPQAAKHLAWLDLDTEAGQEYWLAMNLAGDYASACHHQIHERIADALQETPLTRIENHHNFAWKEQWEGKEVIVHRKGATPAGKDVLGIIPGSMTADGYIVKGKGEVASVNSASHGAGRKMSRTRAIASVTDKQFKDELKKFGVKLLGGGLDESPFAYKDIEVVMQSQKALVDVVGKFTPKIVKMDGASHRSWKKKNDEVTGE